MLVDGLTLTDTSEISNPIVASGTIFPTGSTGELFYRTDTNALYVYDGSGWIPAANGIGFADLNIKPACVVGTTANITLGGFQTIDGYTVVAADRVLVKNQSTGSQNGIYVVSGGSWARADDFDGTPAVLPGDFVFVTRGTAQADTGWVLTTDGVIQMGSTALTFAQFTGASSFNGGTISTALTITSAVPQITLGVPGGSQGNLIGAAGSGTTRGVDLSLTAGASVSAVGGDVNITAGLSSTAGNGGAARLTAGAAASGYTGGITFIQGGRGDAGGAVYIAGGHSDGGSTAGYISLNGGTGPASTGVGGYIVFNTAPISALVERFRILNNGAWSVGAAGTNTGTSGQVLTSTGATTAPTWQAAAAAAAAAGTLTGTTLAANVVSSSLTSVGTLSTLTVAGNTSGAGVSITAGSNAASTGGTANITGGVCSQLGGAGGGAQIAGGAANNGGTGGTANLIGGNATTVTGATAVGGTVNVRAGNGLGPTSPVNAGGSVIISAGTATTANGGGYIALSTATSGPVNERLRILNSGAWSVGPNGTDTGTSGQVLTSTGATTAPTWQAAGGFTGGTVSGATTFTSAAPQITLGVAGSIAGQIIGANNASGSGAALNLTAGTSSTGAGSAINVTAGATTGNTGGAAAIRGGAGSTGGGVAVQGGAGNVAGGGAVTISGGAATSAGSGASGGAVTISGGGGTDGPGANVSINAAAGANTVGSYSRAGGDLTLSAGNASAAGSIITNANGGQVYLRAGAGIGTGAIGGNLALSAGSGTAGTGGVITLSTGNTVVERLRILNTGAWSVGSTGTAYGTSGQVLTSNGNAAPTWSASSFAGGTVPGATTFTSAAPQITLGIIGNSLAGQIAGQVAGGTIPGTSITIAGGASSISGVGGGSVSILGGSNNVGTGNGGATGSGSVTIQGGNGNHGDIIIAAGMPNGGGGQAGSVSIQSGPAGNGAPGGTLTIAAGDGTNNASGLLTIRGGNSTAGGGNVQISGGVSSGGTGGAIIYSTGTTALVERLRVLPTGAWSVGTGGAAYGTAGQVLTSNGNAAPTWSAAPGFSGGTITGATTFTSAAPQITLGTTTVAGQITQAAVTGAGVAAQLLTFQGGAANGGTGGAVLIKGGSASATGGYPAGALTVTGGDANGGQGGDVIVSGGANISLGSGTRGGNLSLNAGLGGIAAGGYMSISTAVTNTLIERLRILNNGAWSVGTGGAAYGTAGQVLTSNGNAAPTWTTIPATIASALANTTTIGDGTANAILQGPQGTGTSGNVVIKSGITSSGVGGIVQIYGMQSTAAAGQGGSISLAGGAGGSTSGAGGAVNLQAGNSYGATTGADVSIIGGVQAGTGIAGNVILQGGTNGTGGAGGAVIIQSVASGYAPVERLRILNNGAWSVGTGGTAYGTAGQVLTSNGNAVPTWSTVTSVGTLASLTVTGVITTAGLEVGTKIMPQNVQSIAYTTVLADSGAHVLHPSADTTARIYTIPANASVPYPIGTQLTFVNQDSAGVITIGITSDVMRLAGAGTTGDRTLAANGIATALKITGTEWIISGTGLS